LYLADLFDFYTRPTSASTLALVRLIPPICVEGLLSFDSFPPSEFGVLQKLSLRPEDSFRSRVYLLFPSSLFSFLHPVRAKDTLTSSGRSFCVLPQVSRALAFGIGIHNCIIGILVWDISYAED
jgi:hypothetical protein